MIEVKGFHNQAVCFCSRLDQSAEEQIRGVCNREEFSSSKIRIMPDVHAGMGCTIGTTMTVTDKIVPGMVGVDIGCGMETVCLGDHDIELDQLDFLIRREIPSGFSIRNSPHPLHEEIDL